MAQPSLAQAPGPLTRADDALARYETGLAAVLLGGVFVLLLAGAAFRTLGHPLLWSDELAVLMMCCAGFFGASAALARRRHIAVDLLVTRLPARGAQMVQVAVQLILLAGLAGFAVMLWAWFDPVGLIRYGSAQALSQATFNFIYQEPTVTLGVPKFWAWLVLIPFCAGCLFHILARLVQLLRGEGAP